MVQHKAVTGWPIQRNAPTAAMRNLDPSLKPRLYPGAVGPVSGFTIRFLFELAIAFSGILFFRLLHLFRFNNTLRDALNHSKFFQLILNLMLNWEFQDVNTCVDIELYCIR